MELNTVLFRNFSNGYIILKTGFPIEITWSKQYVNLTVHARRAESSHTKYMIDSV